MGNVLAQLDAALVLRDHRWFCRRQYQLKRYLCQPPLSGLCNYAVDFFFIDTTPFINEYSLPGIHEMFDWRGLAPRDIQLQHQMKALDQALEQSTATWKIVVGHHTIRSFGHHGDSKDLISKVLPILEAHGVNAYINGHDHCLQHIKSNDSKVHFLTSGGGSKAWQGIQKAKKSELHFAYDGQGFLAMSLNERSLNFDFYDAFGNNLHSIHIGK
ncbi:hypothetical protein O6H91_04G136200 [Diphasiastrum complanatum]|nr:hypothetical protein O6H91_04G136200 [Diphasiastrum complanatum]